MSATLAVQQTFLQILTTDPELSEKISGVFDSVKQDQAFPYVTIGEGFSNPFNSFEHPGEEVVPTIHIWSRYKGFKEGQEIAADIHRLLTNKTIEVEGYGNVDCFFDNSETMRDTDGITRHIMLRYRLLIQH
jgi:hypothetical protein